MGQCQGLTKKGEQCKREALEGSELCSVHHDTQDDDGARAGAPDIDVEAGRGHRADTPATDEAAEREEASAAGESWRGMRDD